MAKVLLNPHHVAMKNGKRKCFGCNLHEVSNYCIHRWWPIERRKGYSFRMFFGKPHLLPTCKRATFDYKEQEEYKQKYCNILGVDPTELVSSRNSTKERKMANCEIY